MENGTIFPISETEYSEFTASKAKDHLAISTSINAMSAGLIHYAMGIASEAGEVVDAVKKHAIYRKPLDVDNIIEELGDLEWFMDRLRKTLGISRDLVLYKNMEKLNKRYQKEYSDEAAQARADKNDEVLIELPSDITVEELNKYGFGKKIVFRGVKLVVFVLHEHVVTIPKRIFDMFPAVYTSSRVLAKRNDKKNVYPARIIINDNLNTDQDKSIND